MTPVPARPPSPSNPRSNELVNLPSLPSRVYLYTCGHFALSQPLRRSQENQKALAAARATLQARSCGTPIRRRSEKSQAQAPTQHPVFLWKHRPPQRGKSMGFSLPTDI